MKRSDFGTYITVTNRGDKVRLFIPPKPPFSNDLGFSAEERKCLSNALFSMGKLAGTADFSAMSEKLANLTTIAEFASSLRQNGSEISLFEHFSAISAPDSHQDFEKKGVLGLWLGAFDRVRTALSSKQYENPDLWSEMESQLGSVLNTNREGAGLLGLGAGGLNSVPPPPEVAREGLRNLNDLVFRTRLQLDQIDLVAILAGTMLMLNPYGVQTLVAARMVVLAILTKEGLINKSVPFLSVAMEKDSHRFTEALSRLRNDGDWEKWIAFFSVILSEAAELTIRFNADVTQLRSDDCSKADALGRPAESIAKVLDVIYEVPVFTSNYLVSMTGITPATINKSLVHLEELSIIREVTSKKRGRVFQHDGLMRLLKGGS